MSSGKLVSGFFTLLAQALATNLACCPDMRTFLGVSGTEDKKNDRVKVRKMTENV